MPFICKHPVINDFKTCIKCNANKSIDCFYENKSNKTGYRAKCKDCLLEENKIQKKIYRSKSETKEKEKEYNKTWSSNNRNYLNSKKRTTEYKEKRNSNRREKYKNDVQYNIEHRYRTRLQSLLKNGLKIKRTLDYLGCSPEYFKLYIESLFLEGMNWENRNEWHIDHIIPCCAFDFTKEEDILQCFNYKNLRPLWATENHKKIKTDLEWKKLKLGS